MKTFQQYLTEARPMMTVDAALKVLGLQPGFTPTELKAAYRALALKNHPDRNPGDTAAELRFKEINNANEILQDTKGTIARDASFREQQEAMKVKRGVYAGLAAEVLKKHLHIDAYEKHFDAVFGESFHIVRAEVINTGGSYSDSIDYIGELSNQSKSIVLTIRITVSFAAMFQGLRLSNPDEGMTIYIATDILYNRRVVKLFQQHYQMTQSYSILSDPNKLFPAAKLKAQAAKSQTRNFSKRDALLTLQKELNATFSNEWVYLKFGDYRVAMYRNTMMGAGSWQFNQNVSGEGTKKGEKAVIRGFVSFLETAKTFDFLVNGLRHMQASKFDNAQQVAAAVEHLSQEYKSKRDELASDWVEKDRFGRVKK